MFIFIWTIQLSQNYYSLFNPIIANGEIVQDIDPLEALAASLGFRGPQAQTNIAYDAFAYKISGVMTFSAGIFLTAVRFVEPLFRILLWSYLY